MPKVATKTAPASTKAAPAGKKTGPKASPEKKGKTAKGNLHRNKAGKGRPVVHDEVGVTIHRASTGNALTREDAENILGWVEIGEVDQGEFLLKDENGVKIVCNNNVRNRQLYLSSVATLRQDILRGRWKLNCENLIIGRTGLVLNGQHSLVALIAACQVWEKEPGAYPFWQTEPTIDKIVAVGCDESDDVVNTIDTGKGRSLKDVLYRSDYFQDIKPGARGQVARIAEYGVKLLWYRTGAGIDAYAPRRTHAESLDFIERHPRLLECVRFMADNNAENDAVAKWLSPGTAAGLMYLMATSQTDPTEYRGSTSSQEAQLDFGLWDSAEEFWTRLIGGDKAFIPLREKLVRCNEDGTGGSIAERLALLSKAWVGLITGEPFDGIELEYQSDDDGNRYLAECPSVGGIDYGDPSDREVPTNGEPTKEDIEAEKAKIKAEREEAKRDVAKRLLEEQRSNRTIAETKKLFKMGDQVEVDDPETGEEWIAEYLECYEHHTGIVCKVIGVKGERLGATYHVNSDHLKRVNA